MYKRDRLSWNRALLTLTRRNCAAQSRWRLAVVARHVDAVSLASLYGSETLKVPLQSFPRPQLQARPSNCCHRCEAIHKCFCNSVSFCWSVIDRRWGEMDEYGSKRHLHSLSTNPLVLYTLDADAMQLGTSLACSHTKCLRKQQMDSETLARKKFSSMKEGRCVAFEDTS